VSLFKFRVEDLYGNGSDEFVEFVVDDSADSPGELVVQCGGPNDAYEMDLPRAQVEKLVARLNEWLHLARKR
jgi:hypothetical protein